MIHHFTSFSHLMVCFSVIVFSTAANASNFSSDADTLNVTEPQAASAHCQATHFRLQQLYVPASLAAAGGIIAGTGFGHHFQENVKDGMADLRNDHYIHADDYIRYVPVAAYVGLGLCGISSKHNIKDRLLAGSTAFLAMTALTSGLKYSIRERRPDMSTRNSFPSGHTATAFTGAELVRSEYGLGIGIAAYGVAAGVALLRLYNERHWVGDVLFGAGIGILSARIGYWMLPLWQKWLKIPSCRGIQATAIPLYQTENRTIGGAVVLLL